jgi:hypothetical protein
MTEKKLVDVETFVKNVNKKNKKRNGLKVRFGFTKRKR